MTMVGYQHFSRFAVQVHLSTMARASKFWRNLRRWLKMCGPKFAMEKIEILAQANSQTKLDVMKNAMGDEGKAIIRKAVEGREGFVLEM
jgi:hypothetical protein